MRRASALRSGFPWSEPASSPGSQAQELPVPVQRALAFQYLLERVSLPVEEGQLIVGLRGTGPKEIPTYPKIGVHSLADLEIRRLYAEEMIPFWRGKSMRDLIFGFLPPEWMAAYEAGVWTEFMEQRAPGHTVGGERMFRVGLLEIKEEIADALKNLDPHDSEYYEKCSELQAMDIAADALLIYASRYAEEMAKETTDPARKQELEKMAEICRLVPAHAPRTFWEAFQHYWFIHVGVTYETHPWDSFSPGRIE